MLAASPSNFEVSRAHWRTSRRALIAVAAGAGSLFKRQLPNPYKVSRRNTQPCGSLHNFRQSIFFFLRPPSASVLQPVPEMVAATCAQQGLFPTIEFPCQLCQSLRVQIVHVRRISQTERKCCLRRSLRPMVECPSPVLGKMWRNVSQLALRHSEDPLGYLPVSLSCERVGCVASSNVFGSNIVDW